MHWQMLTGEESCSGSYTAKLRVSGLSFADGCRRSSCLFRLFLANVVVFGETQPRNSNCNSSEYKTHLACEESTLAFKSRSDVTTSSKQGISDPTKRAYVLQKLRKRDPLESEVQMRNHGFNELRKPSYCFPALQDLVL